MLRGGSVPSAHVQQAHLQQLKRNYTYRVVTASLPAWIETSFTEQDYVVLKLDIEGAEHSILAEMMARGLMRLVDVLTLECHAPQSEPAAKGSTCAALLARLARLRCLRVFELRSCLRASACVCVCVCVCGRVCLTCTFSVLLNTFEKAFILYVNGYTDAFTLYDHNYNLYP